MTYPTDRQSCGYSIRYIKALLESDAIRDHGPEAVLLSVFIASREDRLHYAKPPKFWRAELMDKLGKGSPKDFLRIRNRATEAGLLFHQEATRTTPGLYWTLVPEWLLPRFEAFRKGNGKQPNRSEKGTAKGTANGTAKGTAKGTLSIPITQVPITQVHKTHSDEKSSETVSLKSKKRKTQSKTMAGFEEWYATYPKRVAKGAAEKAYPKALSEIQASERVNEVQAVSLLLQWTQERSPRLLALESQYRPNPATWLNAKSYRDEIYSMSPRINGKPTANVGAGVIYDPTRNIANVKF